MLNATRDLTVDRLRKNFEFWAHKMSCGDCFDGDASDSQIAPLTHTFPSERPCGTSMRDLCREVLESEAGILSDYYREANNLFKPGEPRAEMIRSRLVGLNHFVFAYLGVHDPYYSRCNDAPMPPFGLFLRRTFEEFPQCNATRRDLASPESIFDEDVTSEFLLPEDGRKLAGCEAKLNPKHKASFWRYWGAIEFWKEPLYAIRHWEWKFEFHFLERMPINGVEAILWPIYLAGIRDKTIGDSLQADRAKAFQNRHPECKVIMYDWSDLLPTFSFVEASTAVMRYFITEQQYPEFIGDALAQLKNIKQK